MKKLVFTLLLTVMCFSVIGFASNAISDNVSQAADIYDMFTDEHILFYESDIAKRPVVSNINQAVLEKTALNYNISVDKLKKVMVVQHAFSQCGYEYSVADILAMPTGDLLRAAKTYISWLKENTSPEEFAAIGEKFKTIKKAPQQS